MSNLVPFESAQLPAYLNAGVPLSDDLGSSFMSYPNMSIKGKVFTLKRGEEKTILKRMEYNSTGQLVQSEAAADSIEVVILRAYPAGNVYSKTFYSTGYVEGTDAKPDCYSDDGIAPAADVENKQANKCAICPMNVKGSKVSEAGVVGKACSSSKILAIATPDRLDDPIKLRVPGKSTIALKDFGELVKKRGFPYQAVVVKIGFLAESAFPDLSFKPAGFLPEDKFLEAMEMRNSDLVEAIVGAAGHTAPALPAPAEEAQAPAAAPVAKPKPAPVKTAPKPPVDDDLPTDPKVKVKVEEPAVAPAAAAKPKPAPVVAEVVSESIDEGMSASLDDLDFDD